MEPFIALQYCYNYLIDQISIGLLFYSHIPTAITGLILGSFSLFRARRLPNILLFFVSLFFAIWCLLDLGSWFAFLGSGIMMTTWSLADLFAPLFFFFSYYFLYTFLTDQDLPLWQKGVGVVLIMPIAIWIFLGEKLLLYNANLCEAYENVFHNNYQFLIEGIFLLSTIILAVYLYLKAKDREKKKKVILASTGVVIFLGFFLLGTLGVNLLVDDTAVQFAYNFEIYGLFGMPVLLGFLMYLIVRYKAFNIKTFGAQALVVVLVALIGSQFFFAQDLSSTILTAITLVITGVIGINLVRSVKKEVTLREDLEIANKGQESLIHLMNHQIKGYLGKDRSTFAELLTGDYGVLPETAKTLVQRSLIEATKGVEYVQGILKGASAEKGTLPYSMKEDDIKPMVMNLLASQKDVAEKAGLTFTSKIAQGDYVLACDITQLEESFKNLITNAIKYNTPNGSVSVNLAHTGGNFGESSSGKIIFSVKDTGIGVSDEDKPRLFTAGGMGKNSIKHNTDASGFGLAFVKGVAQAHKGTVGYRSNSPEKGTTFFIELPVN